MNKNTKKILTLSVLSLFMFAFAMSFVSAEPATAEDGLFVTLWKAFFGGIGGDGAGFWSTILTKMGIAGAEGADFATTLSFLLLMFIVFLLIYDIADMLPFLSEGWMKWAFSIAFAVLAFMFFDMNNIKYLISTYQAVGITLLAIVPFIVIATFAWKLDKKADDETKPSYQMFGSAVWLGFGVYLVFRLVELSKTAGIANAKSPIFLAYAVLTLAAFFAAFSHTKLYGWFAKKTKGVAREMGMSKDLKITLRHLRNRAKEIAKSLENSENLEKDELDILLGERKQIADQIKRVESEI